MEQVSTADEETSMSCFQSAKTLEKNVFSQMTDFATWIKNPHQCGYRRKSQNWKQTNHQASFSKFFSTKSNLCKLLQHLPL